LPGDYTFTAGDNGVHTFANGVTLFTAGIQTVIATDTSSSSITGSATITVVPGINWLHTEDQAALILLYSRQREEKPYFRR
jgi:hypothetical protein